MYKILFSNQDTLNLPHTHEKKTFAQNYDLREGIVLFSDRETGERFHKQEMGSYTHDKYAQVVFPASTREDYDRC